MRINGKNVEFSAADMHFVKKFGILEATNMVLDFAANTKLPFIYDTYQLADVLCITRKQLFDIVKNCNKYYRTRKLAKKNGGFRTICMPLEYLKLVQRWINKEILYKIPISEYATAYHKGAKLIDNAKPHISKKYVLKLDLKDFFGSISFEQIYSCVFNSRRFPKHIGVMLTELCCKNGSLPQGAPTSPAISNIVMRGFDDAFGNWCKKQGFSYSRYCDDITVSGDSSLYVAFVKVKSMLESMGFELNGEKTHFITNASRQTVTGLCVNERARIPADYRRNLRQEIYYAEKFGVSNAVQYAGRTDFIFEGMVDTEGYLMHLEGKIRYILQIEPDNKYFAEALKKVRFLM